MNWENKFKSIDRIKINEKNKRKKKVKKRKMIKKKICGQYKNSIYTNINKFID